MDVRVQHGINADDGAPVLIEIAKCNLKDYMTVVKPERFIITGLPRSRTGWLANLFTYGSCFCLHDGVRFGTKLEFWDRLEALAKFRQWIRWIGNSDSGLPLSHQPGEFPGVKFIFVTRDRREAAESFATYFENNPYPEQLPYTRPAWMDVFNRAQERLEHFKAGVPSEWAHSVDFDGLNSVAVVEGIWNFIAPDEPFFKERFEQLDKLRVNPMSRKVRMAA